MNYKDRRWISKRSEVFIRDKNKCRACGSKQLLQCHHSYYLSGKELWEYPMNSYYTLCHKCHTRFHLKHKGSQLVIRGDLKTREIVKLTLNFIKSTVKINPPTKKKAKYFKHKKVKDPNKSETLQQKRNRLVVPQWKIDEFRKNNPK